MMNPIKTWNELPAEERMTILWTLALACLAVMVILYGLLVSRGQDVEYFKTRLALMEQRVNFMDQKIDTTAQRQVEQRDHLNEIRRMVEANRRQLDDNQAWIDHWKTLPQLPKPAQKR